jgi:hypothetical protein
VIGVGASTNGTTRSINSSYGFGLDIVAFNTYITTIPNGNVATVGGTSFSSPQVAGGVSLMMTYCPDASREMIMHALYNGATDL